MKRLATRSFAIALTLGLATLPLVGCGGAPATGSSSSASSATSAEASSSASAASTATPIDTSSMTTMADVLAKATSNDISYSYNDNYFVCVMKAGNNYLRAVAKMDPSKQAAFANLDATSADHIQKLTDVIGSFELVSVADVTGEQLSQSALEAYVGKTGQDLLNDGFVFESYFMYGGEQTCAEMSKGSFSYNFTFDVHTSEDKTEDGGASIKNAKVTEVQGMGNVSNTALNPELVEAK